MLKLNVERLTRAIETSSGFQNVGKLHSVRGLLGSSLKGFIGEICQLQTGERTPALAEIVGFDARESLLMCYDAVQGLKPGIEVRGTGRSWRVPAGRNLLGRVIDGLGRPLDHRGPIRGGRAMRPHNAAPSAMKRQRIKEPLCTGQRAIDGLLTVGRGQRIGLFAGSGVGKSTLLGEIARQADADLNVIVLVGERGREVRPFVDDCLGPAGLARSVVVVATSDESALMRIRAVTTAVALAEEFRALGKSALFFLDSLTRLAFAQRELGLLRGEPPGLRGYPPSVQAILAEVLERLGNDDHGSITGIITVLVDGDDLDEPISDAARSLLDGHIVLDRKLASRGHFPAIDVLSSVSRLFRELADPDQIAAATQLRRLLANYRDAEDLIRIGAYQPGTSAEIDAAQRMMPVLEKFLRQEIGEYSDMPETLRRLRHLGKEQDASS